MKTILKCWALVLAILLTRSAFGATDARTEFKVRCAPCHGAMGAGDTKLGQNLRVRHLGSPDVQNQSNEELAAIIRNGKGKMPANRGKLTKEQIDELVKFIRTLKK